MKKYFVTGTDTEVGKTFVTSALLNKLSSEQKNCFGLKPIASGCELIDEQWKNEDALSLMENSSLKLSYDDVNPIALPEAIAPHLAAKKNNIAMSVNEISKHCKNIFKKNESIADCIIVEGAGGWFVPLNNEETYADLVKALNLDVILVVGVRLGCINHALLTEAAVKQSGLRLVGWVANSVDAEIKNEKEIIDTLKHRIKSPCLGMIPFISNNGAYSEHIVAASQFLQLPD